MIRTRIAPSPTGIAHLGTAYTALRNWALAKQAGGKFIVRIEDTDRERYVEGAVEVIFDALSWLGITHDEGPDLGGPHAPYTQSERLPIYQEHASQLVKKGKAYYCFCSKERLEQVRQSQLAKKLLPRYDRHCRLLEPAEVQKKLASGAPSVIRLKVPVDGVTICHDEIRGDVTWENSGLDDQVLLKSDGFPTYHLGVVVDDYLMGITHIIRGEEWLSSSPKHILLYQAFGWELPVFAHLPVIRNQDKSKMSKRKNDVSILSHRDRGYLPEAINNFLALMGWSHPQKKEVFPISDFVKFFSLARVTMTAPVYDLAKLNWLNGQYIRMKSDTELVKLLQPFAPPQADPQIMLAIAPLIKPRLTTLADFIPLAGFFFADPPALAFSASDQAYLSVAKDILQTVAWDKEAIESSLTAAVQEKGWKNGPFFAALRLAVSGKKISPPLTESMLILGREVVLKRIDVTL